MLTLNQRRHESFAGSVVDLDGNWFEHCTFTGCVLVFNGSQTFGYAHDCQFIDCRFELRGIARMVMGTLAGFIDDATLCAIADQLRRDGRDTMN